jgi:hypothetical protein
MENFLHVVIFLHFAERQSKFSLNISTCTAETPEHAGPMDKSGKNQFGSEKHWFPPDRQPTCHKSMTLSHNVVSSTPSMDSQH